MITAEEARALLDGTTPVPWEVSPSIYGDGVREISGPTLSRPVRYPVVADHVPDRDAPLVAAAPDLAQAVIDLHAELAAARERENRIQALGRSWVGFDDSHHYGDAVLKIVGDGPLNGAEPKEAENPEVDHG